MKAGNNKEDINKAKNILQGYMKELNSIITGYHQALYLEDDKVIRIRNADSSEIRELRIKNKTNKANAEKTKKVIQEYIKTLQKVF